jgi:hypothetical protein
MLTEKQKITAAYVSGDAYMLRFSVSFVKKIGKTFDKVKKYAKCTVDPDVDQ